MSTFRSRQTITVDSVDSTNALASRLLTQQALPQGSVIIARHQASGRGQFGALWWSEPGNSLTCSIVLTPTFLRPHELFLLNMAVSSAVRGVLADLMKLPAVIKWPNDILLGEAKLSGILIENTILAGEVRHTIVGIGVNVNQTAFPPALTQAVSMKQATGLSYSLDDMVALLVDGLEAEYDLLRTDRSAVNQRYHEHLFGLGQRRQFSRADEPFMGIIRGVTMDGYLEVELEDGARATFAVKEVVFG